MKYNKKRRINVLLLIIVLCSLMCLANENGALLAASIANENTSISITPENSNPSINRPTQEPPATTSTPSPSPKPTSTPSPTPTQTPTQSPSPTPPSTPTPNEGGSERHDPILEPQEPQGPQKTQYYSEDVPENMLSHGKFSGWIVADLSISNVCITVNGTKLYAKLETRGDVSKAYPTYKYVKGYSLTISPYYVKDGKNSYSVVAKLSNGESCTIQSGKFTAEKVDCIYDDTFFKMRYASNKSINSLKTAAEREKFFYDNLNKKVSDGYKKDYLCGSMVCDLGYYYSANKDLARIDDWEGYQIYDHFIHNGLKAAAGKEYRAVSPWVSLKYLHDKYADLKSMTPEHLLTWAATWGVKFDQRLLANTNAAKAYKKFYNCAQYASKNGDLVTAFSKPGFAENFSKSSCDKYWKHLWECGVAEKRVTSNNFDVRIYCKNAGLKSKSSAWQVFYHYCNSGYAKGIKTK